jgi:hypothetical protein
VRRHPHGASGKLLADGQHLHSSRGRRIFRFMGKDSERRRIQLDTVSVQVAEEVRMKVEPTAFPEAGAISQ